MSRIGVAGGTGLAGRHVVDALRRSGHEAVVLSRARGVDLVAGAGLADALRGATAAIDVTNTAAADPDDAATGVTVAHATADAAQDDQLTAALDALAEQLGVPEALVGNSGLIQLDRPRELSRQPHGTAYAINVLRLDRRRPPGARDGRGGRRHHPDHRRGARPDPAVTSLSLGKGPESTRWHSPASQSPAMPIGGKR